MLPAFFTEELVDRHGCIILNHYRPRGNQGDKDISYSDDGLFDCDCLDLDLDIFGKTSHLDSCPGRVRRLEKLAVDSIHLGEVIHILKENRAFDDLVEGTSGSLNDGLHVSQNETRLLLDSAKLQLPARRVDRDLTGGKDESVGFDGLRVGADRFWRLIRLDFFFHVCSPSFIQWKGWAD